MAAIAYGYLHAVCGLSPAQRSQSACGETDFWLGAWQVCWEAILGIPAGCGVATFSLEGECLVMRDAFGAAVERRQFPLDSESSIVAGFEGERFIVAPSRANAAAQRIVFEEVRANSLTCRWQMTPDADATWVDQWVIHYTRASAP